LGQVITFLYSFSHVAQTTFRALLG